MPLISIIIPIYNAEKYLNKCLQSIISQTFQDFEVILINDGSTDCSYDACQVFAKKDKRFTLLTQTNSGASSARNRGIEMAKGKWITFVDADDYIEANYIERLCKNITDEKTLIIQGLKQVNSKGEEIKMIEFEDTILTNTEIQKAFDEKEIFEYGYTVAKLYNHEIIDRQNIRFNEQISYSEDMLFMLEYILNCNTIKFISGASYNYITDISNLSQRYNSFESEYLLFTEYIKTNQAIANKWDFAPSYKSQRCGALMLMRSIYCLYKKVKYCRRERISIIKDIKQKYSQYIKEYYTPNITFLRVMKVIFFFNVYIFDVICYKKLRPQR